MKRQAKKAEGHDPIYAPPKKKLAATPIPLEQSQEWFREFAAGDDPTRNIHLAAAAYLDAVRKSVADLLRAEGVEIGGGGLPLFKDGRSESCHPLGKASRKVTRAANVLSFLFGHTSLAAQRAFDAGRSYEMLRNAIHLEPLVEKGRRVVSGQDDRVKKIKDKTEPIHKGYCDRVKAILKSADCPQWGKKGPRMARIFEMVADAVKIETGKRPDATTIREAWEKLGNQD